MEFRIVSDESLKRICEELDYPNIGRTCEQLLPSERVELIKQLCPEINRIAVSWIVSDMKNYTANFGVDRPFTDYLMEELGK
jgi:hypothetical protein